MRVPVLVAILVGGCFMTPVIPFGGNSSQQAQHVSLVREVPPGLVAASEWHGEVAVAKIRVWADDDYRAQNVHWERAFQDNLDYANEVLVAEFGVRLTPEFRAWDHHASDAKLDSSLADLRALDAGTDVFAVVGLTSALAMLSPTFDQLGLAELPGRHLVVRGFADRGERAGFDRAFPDLSAAERAQLYDARRRHKLAALLLHELGHTLGAPHRGESETVMSPLYSPKSASFDDASHAIVLASLASRLHRTAPAPTHAAASGGLAIAVDRDGHGAIGGKPLDDDTLDGLLEMTFADEPTTEVIVTAPRDVPDAAVARIVERVKAAGFRKIAIVRE